MEDKDKKKESAKKSLLMKILSFGARSKAEEAPRERFLNKEKIKKFKLKRDE